MNRSLKYLLAALLIVAGVSAITYFSPAGKNLQGRLSPSLDLSPEISLNSLTVSEGSLGLSEDITYGSGISVLNFVLTPSGSSAAVSELNFKVTSKGLKSTSASDWKVYPVSGGSIDTTKQVGRGTTLSGSALKVSMYDQTYGSSYAQKLSGAEEFVLVTKITDDGIDNTNSLKVASTSTAKWIGRSKVKKSYSASSWYTTLKGSVSMALNS